MPLAESRSRFNEHRRGPQRGPRQQPRTSRPPAPSPRPPDLTQGWLSRAEPTPSQGGPANAYNPQSGQLYTRTLRNKPPLMPWNPAGIRANPDLSFGRRGARRACRERPLPRGCRRQHARAHVHTQTHTHTHAPMQTRNRHAVSFMRHCSRVVSVGNGVGSLTQACRVGMRTAAAMRARLSGLLAAERWVQGSGL